MLPTTSSGGYELSYISGIILQSLTFKQNPFTYPVLEPPRATYLGLAPPISPSAPNGHRDYLQTEIVHRVFVLKRTGSTNTDQYSDKGYGSCLAWV